MIILINIPPMLRDYVGGQRSVEVLANSPRTAISGLCKTYDKLSEILLNKEGKLLAFVNLFNNSSKLSTDECSQDLDMPLKEGDRLTIMLAVAGG